MQLVGRNIKFSDDVKAIIRAELATGRYVYEDEVVTAVLYLLLQDMANKGEATETSRAVLNQPLDEILAELRQTLDEKVGRQASPPVLTSPVFGFSRTFDDDASAQGRNDRDFPGKRGSPHRLAAVDHQKCGRTHLPANLTPALTWLHGSCWIKGVTGYRS
jgi:Arc/MetJ-type ribon-helix-helix transcriptional regulator